MGEIWIPNYGSKNVVALDTKANISYLHWVNNVGVRPWGICQSATHVFVTLSGENKVVKIGNEDEWRVYVTCENTHDLSILTTDDQYVNTINLGIRPIGVSVEEIAGDNNNRVWVVNFDSNTLIRLTEDPDDDLVYDSDKDVIEVGQRPFSIGFMTGTG